MEDVCCSLYGNRVRLIGGTLETSLEGGDEVDEAALTGEHGHADGAAAGGLAVGDVAGGSKFEL